jgi:hypothetical protein
MHFDEVYTVVAQLVGLGILICDHAPNGFSGLPAIAPFVQISARAKLF